MGAQGRGPASRITLEITAYIEAQVARQADLTLVELQHLLLVERQVKVSIGRLWAVLRTLDLRLKKVDPRRRTRHRSQPATACGVPRTHRPDRSGEADLYG